MGALTRLGAPIGLIMALSGAAAAQTFTYGKQEDVKDVKEVKWTAAVEGGLLVASGNAETVTGTLGAKGTRLDPRNKLDLAVLAAYARSNILVALDEDMSGTIGPDEIQEAEVTSANSWEAKLRYDRFLTDFDSLYVSAKIGADEPAGKDLIGGGQLGYSRRLYKDDKHEVLVEAGYDFTYENLAATGAESLIIHSARVFTGYKGTVRTDTAVEGSVEALSNLNEEAGGIKAFDDTRVNATIGLSTKLTEDIAFAVNFALKYDHAPAPRAPFATPYDAGFVPLAEELDTITKASLIISIL
jgi:putative salt-induced outer membrane protein YdiY